MDPAPRRSAAPRRRLRARPRRRVTPMERFTAHAAGPPRDGAGSVIGAPRPPRRRNARSAPPPNTQLGDPFPTSEGLATPSVEGPQIDPGLTLRDFGSSPPPANSADLQVFLNPSAGLEPATPSLPWKLGVHLSRRRVAGGIAAPGSLGSRRDSLPSPGSSHQSFSTRDSRPSARRDRALDR